MSSILCGPLNKVEISICYSYIQAGTWIFWWNYIHGTIHKNLCSSRYFSLILFVAACSLKILALFIPVLFTTLLLLILTLFIICIDVNFFLFSKFLSIKVRYWRRISNAKYMMEQNHATEYCFEVYNETHKNPDWKSYIPLFIYI